MIYAWILRGVYPKRDSSLRFAPFRMTSEGPRMTLEKKKIKMLEFTFYSK